MAVTINIPHDPTKVTVFESNAVVGTDPIDTTLKSGLVVFNATNIPPLGSVTLTINNTNNDWSSGGIFISLVGYQGGRPFVDGYLNGNGTINITITNLDVANNINQLQFKFIDLGQ